MLGIHSDIYGGPEFDHLPAVMRLYRAMVRGLESGRQEAFYSREALVSSMSAFLGSLLLPCADRVGKRFLSEKTPDNVLVFEELALLFAEARFLFVVRDPRAIINSMQQVHARAVRKGVASNLGGDILDDLYWIDRSTAAGDRFASENAGRCLVVHYEEVVSAPEAALRDLCHFIGVDFDRKMLETDIINEHSQAVIEKDGVWYTADMYNRPIDKSRAEAWDGALSRDVARLVEDYFARKRYACHARYALRPGSTRTRLRYLAMLARQRAAMRLRAAPAAIVDPFGDLMRAVRVLRGP
jgi:hypothetical protein